MIERIRIAGADVDPAEVLAALTIRHGRTSVDDGLVASTATLTLVGVTAERAASIAVGDSIDLLLADNEPRFRGTLTDATLAEDGLRLVAVSALARIGSRPIGAGAWPEESWFDRISRVLDEAGLAGLAWREIVDTWADQGGAWNDVDDFYGAWNRVLIEGDFSATVSARAAGATTVASYLGGAFRVSVPAAITTLPDGRILFQMLSIRSALHGLPVALDPDLVLFAPEFAQTDEVVNDLEVEWEGGTVTAENADSQARFDRRPDSIRTELADLTEAQAFADDRVERRGFPRWTATPLELLELDTAITIGAAVTVNELPEWAPPVDLSGWGGFPPEFAGLVEGWEDRVESDGRGGLDWSMLLHLSDPVLSGYTPT